MACTSMMPNFNVNNHKFPTHASPRPWSGRVNVNTKSETLLTKRLVVASAVSPTVVATKAGKTMSKLARVWREVQGSSNWKGLVEPLDPLLRQEIIRYGDFVTACYKAFDLNPASKRYLNCKYGKKSMLSEVGLGDSGYEVTRYIYATPDINIPIQNDQCCGRWIGYIAVSSEEEVRRLGRRDILVTFRGTVTNPEWVANFMSSLTPARLDPHNPRPDVKVEAGFLTLYTSDEITSCKFGLGSCREQLLSEVSRLLNKYKGEEMSITLAGHSMGSSLALLLAYDIAELGLNRNNDSNQETPITVFSFAGPRVGNSGFKQRCEELGVKVMRVVNVNDPITKLPGVVFNDQNLRVLGGRYEFPWIYSCYAHVGVELALDFFKMQNPSCVHDLETYLNLLRCPKGLQIRKEGTDLLKKARELILSGAQNIDTLPWKNAASTMMSLVQSQSMFS
ncbi:galactolipase DONGLE, chloroplastic-like [Actinidia eriantha]|uniref:galactolipase DONGLE, chloroplastic-like n=1 Tax=Actinidia eriantha TaxID=165200 RepID=UPI00258EB532|nr:galactolipase DONGLE, chloroplastic-like [Actinidia eriantha]